MELPLLERLVWAGVGAIMIIAIVRRMRPERIEPWQAGTREDMANHFYVDRVGVFDAKVVAIEFEETGPILFVNGEYNNLDERLYIEGVTAKFRANGFDETFISFEPCDEENRMDVRVGDLVNLTAPVVIEAYDHGLFRTPLFSPEREERMGQATRSLGESAKRIVDKFDRDFGEYSLEKDAIEILEREFMNDPVVQKIIRQINDEFIWCPGEVTLRVNFIAGEDEAIEEIPIRLNLSRTGVEALLENVDNLAINFLLSELELPREVYNSVVYER